MLSPKEKAVELTKKFKPFVYKGLSSPMANHVIINAKNCAIMAVDEVLEATISIADRKYEYFKQVREELINL